MRGQKKKEVPSLWETPKRSKALPTLPPISNLTPQFSKTNLSIGTVDEIYETPNSKYAKNLRSSVGFFESNGNIQWRSSSVCFIFPCKSGDLFHISLFDRVSKLETVLRI